LFDGAWDVWDDRLSKVGIEKLASGKFRAVVRHAGQKQASGSFPTRAEAAMAEARIEMSMGGNPAANAVTVGEPSSVWSGV